jgi:hypothetical protein
MMGTMLAHLSWREKRERPREGGYKSSPTRFHLVFLIAVVGTWRMLINAVALGVLYAWNVGLRVTLVTYPAR